MHRYLLLATSGDRSSNLVRWAPVVCRESHTTVNSPEEGRSRFKREIISARLSPVHHSIESCPTIWEQARDDGHRTYLYAFCISTHTLAQNTNVSQQSNLSLSLTFNMTDVEKLGSTVKTTADSSTTAVPDGVKDINSHSYDAVFGEYKEGNVDYKSAGW